MRQQIECQSILPGAALPTEEALQIQYGVSRSVVRQALGELATLGLISRQRGRGSVVAPGREHHRRASQAGGLTQQVAATGQDLTTTLLDLAIDTAPPTAAAILDTVDTWRLTRLRSVSGEPFVYMHNWLSRVTFPTITADELDGGSLYAWMQARGVEPSGGPRQVKAVPADDEVAERLGIAPGTAVLLLQGVTCDPYGDYLEWFSAWHRPDTIFDIDAHVTPRGLGNGAPDLDRARQLVSDLAVALGT